MNIESDDLERFRMAFITVAADYFGPEALRKLVCRILLQRPDPSNWSRGNVEREIESRVFGSDAAKVAHMMEAAYAELEKMDYLQIPSMGGDYLEVTEGRHSAFKSQLNNVLTDAGLGYSLFGGRLVPHEAADSSYDFQKPKMEPPGKDSENVPSIASAKTGSDVLETSDFKVSDYHIMPEPQAVDLGVREYLLGGDPQDEGKKLVFFSYCHKDKWALDRIHVHIKPIVDLGLIDCWDDTKIQPGDRWKEEIRKALSFVKVAVLLVSADFLASDFITKEELSPILTAAKERGVRVLSVILSPCRYKETESLSQYQAINDPADPVIKMILHDQESVWYKLTQEFDIALKPER